MATDFWSEYRRLKKKQLEDTIDAPVKETTSSSSDEGSVFWDEYRQNKKDQITSTATETAKKEEKEKEEKKAEQKTLQKSTSTTSPTSDKLVNGKLMQTQTKQVIKEEGVSHGDIAPVKTHGGAGGGFGDATDGKNDSWIKKSEGNLWQTILGSGTDLTEHVTAGAIGVGEKIVDALTTVGTLIGQSSLSQTASDEMLYNAIHGKEDENVLEKYEGVKKEIEEKSAEFIAKDLYDEEAIAKTIISDPMRRKHGINSEWHSIFGEKSDELAMSAGQLGVQLGANVLLPGSGIAVMGASTFGSEVESAFRNGATFGDAVLSASISTAAEVLTERLGGISFGGKTVTDSVFGELSSRVTGKFARALVAAGKLATDASFEAAEEVVSGYISAWGQSISYMDDKEIEELFSKEDALDAAIGGFVLGGVFSVGEAAITGRDPASGLTKNEQAVVDKEVERRVAEQEKGGKKLTTKEIGAIKKQVQDDMEHGQLDIEMIEEVLGGDSYTAFKDTVESEDGLKAEYEQLANIKKSDLTTKQEERLAELKAMNLGDTTKRDDLRKKLNETVFPQLKDSKLAESYNQVAKKGEAFKADLNKYKGKQREAVERAMKSGVLNDTFRSHELVDVLSKIEAEKGIVFDYTNNAKLKESGFAVEGKTVNGFANKKQGSVTLNVQSAKAWQSVVGHEIAHVLEGTEHYEALRSALYAYAESRGELESRKASLTELYRDMDADIDSELTADLVGDYLFTDKNFVNKLAGNRTLFQKVYDEIKYLWNVATGKEKTEIEKVKEEFDRVWKEYGKEKVQESESQEYSDADLAYSIREEAPPKETGIAYKVFFVKDGKLYPPMVANPDGADTPMGVWLNADVGVSAPPSKTGRAQVKAGGKGTQGGSGSLAFRPGWHLGDLPRASQFDRVNPETGKKELFPENFVWAEVEYAKDVDYQEEAMSYGYTENGKFRHAYAGLPRLPENGYYRYRTNPKPDTVPWVITGAMKVNRLLSDAEVNAILEENGVPAVHRQGGDVGLDKFGFDESGKVQYSISEIVDENGKSYGIGVKLDSTLLDDLTPDERVEMIKERVKELGGQPFTAYDSNGNAVEVMIAKANDKFKNKNGGESFVNQDLVGYNRKTIKQEAVVLVDELIMASTFKGTEPAKHPHDWLDNNGKNEWDVWETYIQDKNKTVWKAKLRIANSTNGEKILYDVFPIEKVGGIETLDTTPTDDSIAPLPENVNTKFSLSSDNKGNQLSKEQQEYFKDSKVRDENGRLKVMYHGTPNKNVNVFSYDYAGSVGGSNHGYGFYFTEDRGEASLYAQGIGDVKAAYLNITNPIRSEANDFVGKVDELFEKLPMYAKNALKDEYGDLDSARSYFKEYINKNGNGTFLSVFVDNVGIYPEVFNRILRNMGYDGIVYEEDGYSNEYVVFDSNQVKNIDNKAPTLNPDIRRSLSKEGESYAPVGNYSTPFRELALDAPVADVADNNVGNIVSDNVAPIPVEEEETVVQDATVDDIKITTAKERIGAKLSNTQTEIDRNNQLRAEAKAGYDEKIAALQKLYDGKKNKDTKTANNILRRIERLRRLSGNVDADYAKRIHDLEGRRTSLSGQMNQDHTKADRLELAYARIDRDLEQRMAELDSEFAQRRAEMEESLADRNAFISAEAGRLYDELASLRKGVRASKELGYLLDHGFDWKSLKAALVNVKRSPGEVWNVESEVEPLVREAIAETYDARAAEFAGIDSEYAQEAERLEADAEAARADARKAEERLTRKALHQSIVEKIKTRFAHLGYDFDTVLKRAKDLSTFATVDNTPQRVMEKSLGYEEGGILADLTVNQVAQNESEAIRWLNSFTNRKSGLLAELSRQYRIKPGSKESAAAQMYAEGFYVGKNDEIIAYSDNELAIDFPDTATQDRIKGLARDPRIRLVYDQTLDMINESRARNAYPEIPRLDNYFLHFRAMEDTFSKLGLPFNPNDIRAKDLPTDLNGVTADLKPGQPYFASAMHREGNRTSFDLLGGMERYLSSAKNQIFHIDDIQTLRALRNYIADTYGQANGLESLDSLTEEEVQDRIKDVFGAHLSTFAKFLNEEANIIAGKTSLADRGIEGILGRRAITFLNDVNRQVGANMVGYNASSALTNFIPVVQTFAKANKTAFVKAFAQTVSNRIGGIAGRSDGFAEASPVMIRRAGADRFHRTIWQKMSDPGYALMGAVDSISTEIVARTKYNELTKKGMNSEQAHIEADKWASRLMGDRSLGQLPHLFESKMLGLVTKFQLEVRNQLDSMFYDTIQEAKASNKDIENALARNAKTAAKVASTFFGLAVSQHLFGKVFESIAGYNPAFDIIDVIAKTFGLDDDDDSEDTVLDNVEQGFLALLEDLPYTSTLSGGRIPISSALPITEFIKGKDEYGNEKSRLKTLSEAAPYYILPGGYGQIKKTAKGLSMFDDDHPVSGSYTDSGNLRFPVEDTVPNRIQAALFGQWANENARDYIENKRKALSPKQVDEYVSSEMTIGDYWDYREGLSGLSKIEEKAAYINGLDIPVWKKNLLINNLTDRKDPISMEEYATYGSIAESDFAKDNPARYELLKRDGVTYEQYQAFDDSKKNAYSWAAKNPEKYEFIESLGYTVDDYAEASDDEKDAWTWAYNNPEKYEVSKAITGDLFEYFQYKNELNDIGADKDAEGKSISGSRKEKVIDYINSLDADYGEKLVLFKSEYPADDTYNNEIIDYLNGRDDLTYEQIVTILKELGFKVSGNDVTW